MYPGIARIAIPVLEYVRSSSGHVSYAGMAGKGQGTLYYVYSYTIVTRSLDSLLLLQYSLLDTGTRVLHVVLESPRVGRIKTEVQGFDFEHAHAGFVCASKIDLSAGLSVFRCFFILSRVICSYFYLRE